MFVSEMRSALAPDVWVASLFNDAETEEAEVDLNPAGTDGVENDRVVLGVPPVLNLAVCTLHRTIHFGVLETRVDTG